MTGGSTSRYPMGMLMYSTIITSITLTYGILRKIRREKLENQGRKSADSGLLQNQVEQILDENSGHIDLGADVNLLPKVRNDVINSNNNTGGSNTRNTDENIFNLNQTTEDFSKIHSNLSND